MVRSESDGITQTPVERLEGVVDGAVERLHLLTSGTGEFFRRLGYADAKRPSSSRPRSSRRSAVRARPISSRILDDSPS